MRMPESKLRVLMPVIRRMPEVSLPKRHVSFNEKLFWTLVVLILFYVMSEVKMWKLPEELPRVALFTDLMRTVMASERGSIIELGIGPIVTGGIVMQLLVGGKMINIDYTNPEDRVLFQGTQKILVIVLTLFEAFTLSRFQYAPQMDMTTWILALQMFIGGIMIWFWDEVVSKWGFGSGVSLFIAAGVSKQIMWMAFSPLETEGLPGHKIGAIPDFVNSLLKGSPPISETIIKPGIYPDMIGVLATIAVFVMVVYAESMRIEIPLTYGSVRGARGRYPLRFVYVSNIPVILTVALFQNVRLWGFLLHKVGAPGADLIAKWDVEGNLVGGLAYYLSSPPKLYHSLYTGTFMENLPHFLVYVGAMISFSIMFGWLWVDITGMDAKHVAQQLHKAGMQIPGFRRDIRVMEKILGRYIPPITLMSSAFIGFIASFADLWGALGTGTGILLTTGIVYRLYEEMASEQLSEMFPAIRKVFEVSR